MSDSRPTLNLASALLAIVVIAGLGIYLPLRLSKHVDRQVHPENTTDEQPRTDNREPPPRPEAVSFPRAQITEFKPNVAEPEEELPKNATAPPADESTGDASTSHAGESAAVFNPEQTSWEAPFNPAYWEATRWKFDAGGMLSSGADSAATFRRSYSQFMFECTIEPQEKAAQPLRIRLKGAQAAATMTLSIDGTRLAITDDSRDPPAVVKEERVAPAAAPGQPARFKLAATGNRLIVTWNGMAVLTCNQIAGQSGRPIRFEFAAGRTPWRIRGLRIEGE